MSLPLGVEALRGEEARPLLDAWHDGVLELGAPFGVWGALPLDGASPPTSTRCSTGRAGSVLSAARIAAPAWLDARRAAARAPGERDAPLLVHPARPAPAGRAPARRGGRR